ncbi:MAG: hypothetical protein ACTSW1_08385 [Candidatus Hodarchaeales archaeon]
MAEKIKKEKSVIRHVKLTLAEEDRDFYDDIERFTGLQGATFLRLAIIAEKKKHNIIFR